MDVLGAPAGVRGVDELGAVEVVLAADGLPHRIRPLAGWAHAARAERAGTAVGEAFAAAHRVHVAATAPEVAAAAAALRRAPLRPNRRPGSSGNPGGSCWCSPSAPQPGSARGRRSGSGGRPLRR